MSVQDLYDQASQRYDEVVETTNYFGPEWLSGQLETSLQPRKVLDLGCATGTLGSILRTVYPDSEIIGVDISPQMIELADERDCYDVTLVHDLNTELKLEENDADLVVALGFMEFVRDPVQTLREIRRLLTPGGPAYISFQEYRPETPELAPRTTRSGDVIHHAYTLGETHQMITDASMLVVNSSCEIGYTSGSGFSCPYVFCTAKCSE